MLCAVSNEQVSLPGLFATEPADLPFLAGVKVRSYLIRTGVGYVAVYNSPGLSREGKVVTELGTPHALLMSHWHEAMYKAPEYGIAAYVGSADLPQTRASMPEVVELSRYPDDNNSIRIISTPGHTAGFSMFLWNCDDHKVLFSGDMIWVRNGRWEAVVLGESDRQRYISSLDAIASLDFDVLIPWVSQGEAPCVVASDKRAASANILEIARRIRNGEDA